MVIKMIKSISHHDNNKINASSWQPYYITLVLHTTSYYNILKNISIRTTLHNNNKEISLNAKHLHNFKLYEDINY